MNQTINTEGFKSLFGELTTAEQIEIAEWLWQNHQELMEFSSMTPAMQRMFAHFYPNVSMVKGFDGNTLSGGRTLPEQK